MKLNFAIVQTALVQPTTIHYTHSIKHWIRASLLITMAVGRVSPISRPIHWFDLCPCIIQRSEGPVVFILQLLLIANVVLLRQGPEGVVRGGTGGGMG